jgi:uncharacterized protein YrzB (UPF0473 family)
MAFFKNKEDKKVIIPGFEEPEDNGVEIDGEVITLPMEDGSMQSFHVMDTVEYKGKQYMVLLADEDITVGDENTNLEVTIVRLNEIKVNKDFEPEYSVEAVTSQKVLQAVFSIFQERVSVEG